MHKQVKDFIKYVRKETSSKYGFRSFFRNKKVLEVGSANINGSPRKYFLWCDYVGVDILGGKGVDVVVDFTDSYEVFCKLQRDRGYDVVISSEMLEHCMGWQKALENMYFYLKKGGLLIITCAAPDRYPHGIVDAHPEDSPATTNYYCNISTDDFRKVLPHDLFTHYTLMYGRGKNDLYFYGIKK